MINNLPGIKSTVCLYSIGTRIDTSATVGDYCSFMQQEKKQEIWLSPMTKAPTPAKMSKGQSDNTKNATKKFDYRAVADRLMTVEKVYKFVLLTKTLLKIPCIVASCRVSFQPLQSTLKNGNEYSDQN